MADRLPVDWIPEHPEGLIWGAFEREPQAYGRRVTTVVRLGGEWLGMHIVGRYGGLGFRSVDAVWLYAGREEGMR